MRFSISLVVVLLLSVSAAHASEAVEPGPDQPAGEPGKPLYATLFIGDFNADPDRDRLARSGGGYGWGLTGGYFLNRHLSVGGGY